MDLGIKGKNAIIAASSAGLGFACAESLAKEGVNVVINGRDAERLNAAAEKLRLTVAGSVTTVVGDIALDETRAALLNACPRPDILITNNGGPPPGRFQDWGRDNWLNAVDSNMLAPLLLIRDVLDGMVERKFGRIINITSAMTKSPMSPMGLSSAARTGLMSVAKGLSKDVASSNVTINNILPERINTDRQLEWPNLQCNSRASHLKKRMKKWHKRLRLNASDVQKKLATPVPSYAALKLDSSRARAFTSMVARTTVCSNDNSVRY